MGSGNTSPVGVYFVTKNHQYCQKNKKSGKKLPVIILNGNTEIWEFDTLEEAEKMRDIFEKNSDSGHKYEVKKM